jgi:diguanylate cyclase (GGDEF)-like protein
MKAGAAAKKPPRGWGAVGPWAAANRRFVLVVAVFGALSLALAVFMVVRSGRRPTYVADNIAQLLSGLVATAMCAVAAHRHQQRWTGWALLAGSFAVAVCGNTIWCYYNILSSIGVVRSSVMGDICAAIAVPLAIAGVLSFPGALGTVTSRLRGALDALMISTGMFFITWVLVLGPVHRHTSGGLAVQVFSLGFPVSDMVVASLVIILATQTPRHDRTSLGLVSAGLLCVAEADSAFSYLTALHRYGIGNTTDIGWVLGYFLVALGALWAYDHPTASPANSERPTLQFLVGTHIPLLGVLAVAVWQVSVHHALDRVSQLSFMAVILTMSARQLIVLVDHFNLSRQLEAKVEERTLALQHQAYHDGLTGLANRALFNRYLDDAVAEHAGTGTGLVVLLIDLHNFKHVNDLYGHQMGDELLVLVARRLRSVLRDSDYVARVGGDEFGVLLHGPGLLDSEHVAGLVSATFNQPFAIGPTSLAVEAAMGLVAGGPEETCGDDLLRDANLALTVAKTKTGGGFETFSPLMHSSVLEALRTEEEMRRALQRNEFVVYYQPVVDLATLTVQGLEALVRWVHPERGFIGPDKFIPVAEATGIISAIGAWVLAQACRDVSALARRHPPLWVSVNVSAVQLEDENLVATVSEALEVSGLDPSRLTLEITETVIMNDVPRSVQVLTALRNVGLKIAIDDFGTGYSSLGALRYLPVDTLKIDRSFVTDLARDRASSDLTRRTLQLAADFALHTVAEGVEELEQLTVLRNFGCDAVQGFLLARPQPLADIMKLLATGLKLPGQAAPPPANATRALVSTYVKGP